MYSFFKKLFSIFREIEKYILVFFLSLMIVLPLIQIILRNFGKAIEEFDVIVRYSVLWICMIASSMAVFENKHIKIDLIGKFTHGRLKSFVLHITNLFGGVVSLLLSIISFKYIFEVEMHFPSPPPFFNIPLWILLLITPIGFAIISIRFFIRAGFKIYNIVRNHEDEDDAHEHTTTIETQE